MKIRLVGAELFHAERRTDITKLIVAFRNFANAPKNMSLVWWLHWPPDSDFYTTARQAKDGKIRKVSLAWAVYL